MITYFFHSTSNDNEAGVRSGWNNPDLSAKGIEQAGRLREHNREASFDTVYASDLSRAVQTAEISFPDSKLVFDERLREMNYGTLNGKPGTEFPTDAHWCIANRFHHGENCFDVEARIRDFLKSHYDSNRNIAIIAHKYPQLALDVIFAGLSWKEAITQDWRKRGR